MSTRSFFALGLCCALAGTITVPARDDLIVNGSFETGAPTITGWTVDATHTYAAPSGTAGYAAEDGNYFALLGNTGGLGTLSQSFDTTAGEVYTLTYYLASNGSGPNEFRADVNGTTYFDELDIAAQAFTLYSFLLTATGATSTLAFYERDDPSYLALDNVSVSPSGVPEPSSLALLGIGAAGLLARRRRGRMVLA